jgi:hypothetical protein
LKLNQRRLRHAWDQILNGAGGGSEFAAWAMFGAARRPAFNGMHGFYKKGMDAHAR